jgi:Plasmid pRiA4b ORF-3-like protein
MPAVRSHDEYTLYIRLAEIEPAIWRRIVVPGQLTLHHLHQVLQVTMGWTHSHLHQFIVPGANESTYYGEPSPVTWRIFCQVFLKSHPYSTARS